MSMNLHVVMKIVQTISKIGITRALPCFTRYLYYGHQIPSSLHALTLIHTKTDINTAVMEHIKSNNHICFGHH